MEDETNNLEQITSLLEDEELKGILESYRKAQGKMEERHFNVFTLSSDLYYRENFHSDIIKAFLDPNEVHREGTLFLDAFIDMLNKHFPDKVSINKYCYKDATVERESGRIDILIKSESARHCIIIENKSNNAGDTDNQLPNYWRKMKGAGYSVDAIVYIPLDEYKKPDTGTWKEADKGEVDKLLCIVPVYSSNINKPNLVKDWVSLCALLTTHIDCVSVLRQFADLLKMLKKDSMNNEFLESFYNKLMTNDTHENVQSIVRMNKELAPFMANRLIECFESGLTEYNCKIYERYSAVSIKI